MNKTVKIKAKNVKKGMRLAGYGRYGQVDSIFMPYKNKKCPSLDILMDKNNLRFNKWLKKIGRDKNLRTICYADSAYTNHYATFDKDEEIDIIKSSIK